MKLKKYLENKNNFFVRILYVIFISTLFCFGVCFAMQTFLNKNASAGSVEEIVNNSIIASQKVLDLENQGIMDLESLALLDLSSFSGINLASNGLTNQNMPAIKNLLEAFPNIEMICLYDNNFNFNALGAENYTNAKLMFGLQNFAYGEYIFNSVLSLDFYWNEVYNQNFDMEINGEKHTATTYQTTSSINIANQYVLKLTGKNNFAGFEKIIETTLVNITQKETIAFERNQDLTNFDFKNYFNFSLDNVDFEIALNQEIDLTNLQSGEVDLKINVENSSDYIIFPAVFDVEDTLAPQISFGEENGFIYVAQNSVFELNPVFKDNGLSIENFEILNDFSLTPPAGKNVLIYKLYAVGEEIKNNAFWFIDDLTPITEHGVSTAKLFEVYVLKFMALDEFGNKTAENFLKIQIVGEEILKENLDEKLYFAIKSVVGQKLGQNRDSLFASDLTALGEIVELYNMNLTSVKGLSLFDFTGVKMLNLALNNLDLTALSDLNQIAKNYNDMEIALFFNKINGAENYEENIVLGIQNIREFYLNSTPDENYVFYEDYNNYYDFSIQFESGLNSGTLFSVNSESFASEHFPQSGYYLLKFVSKNQPYFYGYRLIYGKISLYHTHLEIEAGSDFHSEALNFSTGLKSSDFIIETIDENGEDFKADKVGEFELTYNVYQKSNGSKGELLVSLVQIVEVIDTLGPVISFENEVDYVYLNSVYEPTSASAIDATSGECDYSVTGNVNTTEIGEYELTYSSTDLSGNVSTKTKKVCVIYPPVDRIEFFYDENKFYHTNENVKFEVKFYAGEVEIPAGVFEYKIYVDNEHKLNASSSEFVLAFEEAGRNVITIKVEGNLENGEQYFKSENFNFDFVDDIWWREFPLIGIYTVFIGAGVVAIWVLCVKEVRDYHFLKKGEKTLYGNKRNKNK